MYGKVLEYETKTIYRQGKRIGLKVGTGQISKEEADIEIGKAMAQLRIAKVLLDKIDDEIIVKLVNLSVAEIDGLR